MKVPPTSTPTIPPRPIGLLRPHADLAQEGRGALDLAGDEGLELGLRHRVRMKVAQLALKVEAQRLSLDETKRRLLDVTEANAALDEIGSTMRDALLNWPARVSGLIAAEISVDPHLLQTVLQSHINDLLTEAADRFDPAGLGGDRSPQP